MGGQYKKSESLSSVATSSIRTTVHLILMDCTRFVSSYWELLPRSSSKALACSQTYLGGGGGGETQGYMLFDKLP